MKIGFIASILATGTAIGMAAGGFGVWVLATQMVVSTGTTTLLLWIFSPWRPALILDLGATRRLFSFSGYLLATGLLNTLYSGVYPLLIGKIYGARDLGLYNIADNTQQTPVNLLTNIVSRAAFPLFSKLAHDKDKLRHIMRRIYFYCIDYCMDNNFDRS